MTNLQFVKKEIRRYNVRHWTSHKMDMVAQSSLDVWGNFVSVSLIEGGRIFRGYAKRNPNCDEPNDHIGLSIATFRALKRIDGRKP